MSRREYVIQAGDTFYGLAQRWGGVCDDWLQVNPGVDPGCLQVGQVVILPAFIATGQEVAGQEALRNMNTVGNQVIDEVEMEVEGVVFRVRRQGESKVPYEVQLILPRTEIRKVQHAGEICELQIMLSNVNIVHSPRIMSESKQKEQAQIRADLLKVHETEQGTGNQRTGNQGAGNQRIENQGAGNQRIENQREGYQGIGNQREGYQEIGNYGTEY